MTIWFIALGLIAGLVLLTYVQYVICMRVLQTTNARLAYLGYLLGKVPDAHDD